MSFARPLRAALLLSASFLAVAPVPASQGAPGVYVFPGSGPCNDTLQECIDGVPSGATIRLKDNQPIEIESGISITESVTLEPVPGDKPIVRGPDAANPVSIHVEEDSFSETDVDVITLRNIRFQHIYLNVRFLAGSGSRFTLTGSTITHNVAHNNTNGVNLQADVPSSFVVKNNRIQTTGTGIQYFANTEADATFENNRIFGADLDTEVAGGMSSNVNGGSLAIRNNLIHNVTGCNCGGASGIAITYDDSAKVDVVGNTIDKAPNGVGIEMTWSFATGSVFNNTVTRADQGLWFNGSGGAFNHGSNNSFNNANPDALGSSPGTNLLSVAPKFVKPGQGNFRLQKSSPLVNSGETCNPGGGTNPDLGGRYRVWPSQVDVGAYEYGAPKARGGKYVTGSSEGEVLRGSGGRDVICGLEGDDDIDARGGNDLVYPGPGKDKAAAGSGDDRIFSRDDQKDTGNAGSGADRCFVDDRDAFSSCTMKVAAP